MPNWCENSFTVSHKDPEMVRKFVDAVSEGNLCDTFLPMPEELKETTSPSPSNAALIEKYGASDWYSWCVENWGTKWDVCDGEAFFTVEDETEASGFFNTAWSPPIPVFNKLTELEFDIDFLYKEEGAVFAGHYTSDSGDYYVEYDFSNPNWKEEIDDDELVEYLESAYEYYLEYLEEEEAESA
jgi:hypothetical protein